MSTILMDFLWSELHDTYSNENIVYTSEIEGVTFDYTLSEGTVVANVKGSTVTTLTGTVIYTICNWCYASYV